MQRTVISRKPGLLEFDGIHASTGERLVEQLEGLPSTWVFSDLSLGAWQSHQVAVEFIRQLGLPLSIGREWDAEMPTGSPPSYADTIGMSIDAEARGDRTMRKTLALAVAMVASLREFGPRTFVVMLPRFGAVLGREDVCFLDFFAQGLRAGGGRVVLVNAEARMPLLPGHWRLRWRGEPTAAPARTSTGLSRLIPGIVDASLRNQLYVERDANPGDEIRMTGSESCLTGFVAPEYRPNPVEVSRFEFDRLAARAHSIGWLKAYAQFHGNNFHVEPTFLGQQAWQRFGEGGEQLALALMERAMECAHSPNEEAILEVQAQAMRIAMRDFARVVEVADPAPTAPGALRSFLLQAKGWGHLMCNDAQRAEPYFAAAQELLGPYRQGREALYLKNIAALNRLRSGDVDGALALEIEIANDVAMNETDRRLEYVNAINLARLYRRRGDFDQAEQAYHRAFATTLGARTEVDAIYANVCLARLHADVGNGNEAYWHWLRAALYWAASSIPEALGARVAGAILGRAVGTHENVCEEVSAAFMRILTAATAGRDVDCAESSSLAAPVFVRLEDARPLGALRDACAIGGAGWSLLLPSHAAAPAPYAGPCHGRLRSLLARQLTAHYVENAAVCIVDDRLGREMATSKTALLESCLRLSIKTMIFDGEEVDLDRDVCAHLEEQLHVHWGDAVERIEEVETPVVFFRRYLAPRALSSAESRILRASERGCAIGELFDRLGQGQSRRDLLTMLRQLEYERVIHLSLPEDVSWLETAGIRSHLNVS